MIQIGGNKLLERGDELMHALRRQIEAKELDCNEALALRVISAEHRTQRPCTHLMKNTKRSERVWGRSAGWFRVQRRTPQRGRTPKCNMVDTFCDAGTE